ncbi:hypothetical protein VTK73DRAFT_822 [Phialemonium thermophilum]|uniref:CCD97-like C-terminal domain-containing protein n=1 Tax=Phialemonium thermophilum TaxID=223376 RepID=A0ABR3VUA2_9PEZI
MSPAFDSPSPDPFSRPKPRPPRSEEEMAQVRMRNRRRTYLERHPEYFDSLEHELADPLRYDSLIRRFQSPAEREAEERAKGYSGVLESSLLRGEARLAKLAQSQGTSGEGSQDRSSQGDGPQQQQPSQEPSTRVPWASGTPARVAGRENPEGGGSSGTPTREDPTTAHEGDVDDDDLGDPPSLTKEEARERWVAFLRDRFVRGDDEDFPYEQVDQDEGLDVHERREEEEAWFDDEDPRWAGDDDDDDGGGGGVGTRTERMLQGETGIQDF